MHWNLFTHSVVVDARVFDQSAIQTSQILHHDEAVVEDNGRNMTIGGQPSHPYVRS